jgi:Fe-S cluster assembly iron-binding protein IscA|tara:strand:+ start:131 stop:541 length:411 start_codon:yes stop_codon:yes gene_type:complete
MLRSFLKANTFVTTKQTIFTRTFAARKRRALPPPVNLTTNAEKFFKALTKQKPETGGFRLALTQAESNMHMQFTFDFITQDERDNSKDEKVVYDEENQLFLHVDESALMKVLGSTVDYQDGLKVLNKEGFELSPET